MYEDNMEKEENLQKLFLKVSHLYFTKIYQQLADTGIHPGQLPIIKLIGDSSGLSQREISKRLHIKPPTVAVSIKRMEKAKMVERHMDTNDQRITRIYLTKKGQDFYAAVNLLLHKNEEALFKGFTESEVCLFKRFMKQMITNLDEIHPKEGLQGCHLHCREDSLEE